MSLGNLGLGLGSAVRRGGAPSDNPVQTNIAAWFKYGVGITSPGGFVSQWDDASGNGRNLLQATGTNQPALNVSAILFYGVDNFLKTAPFTLDQPTTVYILVNQITWTAGEALFDGDTDGSGTLYQSPGTPSVRLYAGAGGPDELLPPDAYAVVCAVFNGASSSIRVNNGTAVVGAAGASSMGGFTLGADGGGISGFGHLEAKEAILYAAAHDDATQSLVIAYLADVGGLSI